jgi:hypothetical protein
MRQPAWTRLGLVASLLGLLVVGDPHPAPAQVSVSSEERFFRIEWQIERTADLAPALAGTVSNPYLQTVHRVQLEVQILDEAGQVTYETLGIVGDVPPGGRSNFRLPLPATGAGVVVTVHSFEFGVTQSP